MLRRVTGFPSSLSSVYDFFLSQPIASFAKEFEDTATQEDNGIG